MAIILDETTRAEYLAQTVASTRAALVVSALSGTVVVEVRDGSDVLRASGTMASPWASASGATITLGEVTAAGLTVATGGAPTADWYCQFRSGTRFVRGTFGVAASGRDFTWSLLSFDTGSRGTIGSATLNATGTALPTVTTAPQITGTAQVGATLTMTPGVYANATAVTRQWRRAGVDVSGQTGTTYALNSADLGATIGGYETATNASGAVVANANTVGPVVAAGNPAGLPLVYAANTTAAARYKGAFKVPFGTSGATSMDNSGVGIAYKAATNTLLLEGRWASGSYVTEVTIPTDGQLNTTGVVDNMVTAAFATSSPFFFGVAPNLFSSSGGFIRGAGLGTDGANIYQTFENFYGGNDSGLYKRTGLNLAGGTVTGPHTWATPTLAGRTFQPTQRWYGGNMSQIPAEWQSLLGGPMLIHDFQMSINESQSGGPMAAVFNPADIGTVNPVPNTILLGYPLDARLEDWTEGIQPDGQVADVWSVTDTSTAGSACIPPGTRSLLFFGRKGIGGQFYKPAYEPGGYAARPYRIYCWAYDLNDLVAVKNSTQQPWQPRPYAHWVVDQLPGLTYRNDTSAGAEFYNSWAFDPSTRRLYMAEFGSPRYGSATIVHVFEMSY